MSPVFSIVTPCLNREATIGAAIESVMAQAHPSFEHIIVDGGSTDGTAAVLARYPHLRIHRERDRNLYDAINKGLKLVGGEIVGLLNSDDLYAPGAFAAAERAMADPAIELVIGAAEFFADDETGEHILRRLAGPAAVGLSEANVIGNVTVMNAAFYRAPLMRRLGGFDDRFPLAADKDFWMRLMLEAPRHTVMDDTIIRYRSHDGSLTFAAGGMREKLSRHLLELARTRLRETTPGSPAHAAYRRWHAWAVGYRAMVQARGGSLGGALGTAIAGCRGDALWAGRFAARLGQHWRDRRLRERV